VPRAQRTLRAALAVAAAALFLRVGYVLRQGPPAPLAGDAVEYRAYADSVAARGVYEGPNGDRATRMPGYPLFLAALEKAAGPSTRAVQWAQCVLGALACAFIYLWALKVVRPGWALACGLAAAGSYDLIAPSAWVLTEALYGFLLSGSLCVLYQDQLPPRRRALLGALGLALTFYVRPEVLPFAALILAAAPFALKNFPRRAAAPALGVFLAAASLWGGRNALVLGRFVPVSTIGRYSLYLGLRLPLDHQDLALEPRHVAPAAMPELERDADYLREYRALRARVPLARRLKAYAFSLLTVYYPFLPAYDWTYVLLVPFWLFGFWLALGRRELWPPALIVAGLSVVFAFLAGPVSRYRFGFSPCLIVLAGAGAQELHDRARARRFAWGAGAWTAANLAAWAASAGLRETALRLKDLIWR
jgi:hypothetical protein